MKTIANTLTQNQIRCLSVAAVFLLVIAISPMVSAGGAGMPWESTLDQILQSLQGPVAKFAGVAAIVVTGLMFALGEGGPVFKKSLAILLGLSIAFSATTFVGQIGFAGGALV